MNSPLVVLPDGRPFAQGYGGQPVSSAAGDLIHTVLTNYHQTTARVLDLGCGSGIVAALLAASRPGWQLEGLEIQPEQVLLAQKNCLALAPTVKIIQGDLRLWQPHHKYDIIVSNPPHLPLGSGKPPRDGGRLLARFEVTCSLPAVLDFCRRTLKKRGRALLLYPQARAAELTSAAPQAGLTLNGRWPQSGDLCIFRLMRSKAC